MSLRVCEKVQTLEEAEKLHKQQTMTTSTNGTPAPSPMIADLTPIGGGRSIRKKPAELQRERAAAANRQLDELLEASAAANAAAAAATIEEYQQKRQKQAYSVS